MSPRTAAAADIAVGDTVETVLTEDLTRTRLVMYAGASGDYNPLHTDDVYAREAAGYPGVFAHGMLTMGMTGKAVTDFIGDGELLRYGVRFRSQVWPGDRLVATLTVTGITESDGRRIVELDVVTVNGDGVQVISGTAAAALPA
ncbi:MaoC family dehydratase N-terminal domain-containing protein [Frankia sp. AgPm24]|uniref:MaoC family dehydratase n=1 Tax=Frankia sp. AgPm24 TaxID=631128 RepID=UPI00200C25FE|nr:MaoC/PaaZ C-terminal domain-containing protein [Frankia sp. AgPm24]MCK9922999.1 MaoC family dehydratase N-terminal domain-containing protein [Frankia sp. AgPm24]